MSLPFPHGRHIFDLPVFWRVFFTLVLAFAMLLAISATALAVTVPPMFVYAEAVRGHIVVINWEPTAASEPETIVYRVYRAEGTGTDGKTMPTPAGSGTGWSQIGSTTGRQNTSFVDDQPKKTSTRYWYVVTADSGNDTESAYSPFFPSPYTSGNLTNDYIPTSDANSYMWYISTKTLAPLPPEDVVLTGADNTIDLAWSPSESTNETEYRIYRSAESGVEGTLTATISVSSPSSTTTMTYSDVGVEKYRHYWYRIEVWDSSGPGYRSIERHFRPVAAYRPPAPHGGMPGDDTCSACHDAHCSATQDNLLSSTDDTDVFCLTCHDGTGSQYDIRREFTDPAKSSHELQVFGGTFICDDCHSQHADPDSSPKLLDVSGETSGTATCYGTSGCHGSVDTTHWAGDMSGFEDSVHNADIPEPASGTKNACSTCHMPHASPNEALWTSTAYRSCIQCHSVDRPDLSSPDVYTRMTANADNDSHHDVLERDQDANGTFIACQNCHNTHEVTDAQPLVDPHDPSMSGVWPDESSVSLAVSYGAVGSARYNGFCLECHDNDVPTAADTGAWVDPPDFGSVPNPNIVTQFTINNHGAASALNNPNLHADARASGYTQHVTLSCITCHEPHGTINNYNLRSDVLMGDGSTPRTGRMLVKVMTDWDTSGATKVFDTRFFCSSCHYWDTYNSGTWPKNHTGGGGGAVFKNMRTFPSSCTNKSCHAHDSTSTKRF